VSLLRLDRVTKRFQPDEPPAVDALSLAAEPGEILALLGPSGCGKTTTLRLIAGFDTPDEGTVSIRGQPMAGEGRAVPPEARGVGIVFQDYALFPHLTVAGNVGFGLARLERPARGRRVAEVLDLVGLSALAGRYPHELSGGQQQRVALARALAPAPALLLLDEPFSNLDADLRAQMREEIARILRTTGTTAVFVTHDQQEAFTLADRVGVLHGGRLEQVDTPYEIYHHPATRFVAEFVGAADFLRGFVKEGGIVTEIGPVANPADHP
jgi:iron(III) transport system ATP-binding protein